MRVEKMVGQLVRERREMLSITQDELGKRLGPLLGRPWSRQAVSLAESGQRAFTAAELTALANVLDTRPARLITPPLSVDEIELPSGSTVDARAARDLPLADPFLTEIWEIAKQLTVGAQRAQQSSSAVAATAASLTARVEERIQGLIDELVNDPDEITFTDDQGATEEGKEEV